MPDLDEIFFDLVALDPAERAPALDRHCGDDDALRAEVESLLAVHEEAENRGFLLESPLTLAALGDADADDVDEGAADPWVGRRLGPYRLTARIGDGGMGSVYEAERDDAEFEKRVAIKLIRRGLDGGDILERFRRERQILAALEHPNIARLLDGGSTDDGAPYLVMEHVEGLPIDRWCAQRGAGLQLRLRLFLQVCRAVQYAHQRLVVHRDLKPGNILVAGSADDPAVKLLDFGIAKLVRDADETPAAASIGGDEMAVALGHGVQTTLARHRVLTPAYASPEQHRGQTVTTASDVFSLGVVLFRLLTGELPGDGSDRPPSLSRSAAASDLAGVPEELHAAWPRRLRGDLEAIAAKALRSEPSDRYPGAEALAEDVQRYLDDLPVSARDATWSYRAGKLLRRRTAAVLSGVALALALVASTIVSSALFLRAEEARGMAETERASAQEVSDFLASLLTAGNPAAETSSGTDTTVRQVLDEAAPRIAGELAEQPLVAARLLTIVAEAYQTLGLFDAAEQRAVEGLGLLAGAAGSTDERVRLLLRLAYIHQDQGRFDDALARADEAERLASVDGLDAEESKALALVRAGIYNESGRWQESADAFRTVLESPSLESAERRQAVQGLGIILSRLGRYAEAVGHLQESLELVRQAYGPDHPVVAQAYNDLAWALLRNDQAEEALALLRRSLDTYRKNYSDDHPKVSIASMNVGNALVELGRAEEALPYHEQGVVSMTAGWGPDHSYTASAINNHGNSLHAAGRYAEASERFATAAGIYATSLSPEHPYVAIALRLRSRSEAALGRDDVAYDLARKALEIRHRVLPADHRDLATSLVEVAEMEWSRGEAGGAVAKLEQAMDILPEDCEREICRRAAALLAEATEEGGGAEGPQGP